MKWIASRTTRVLVMLLSGMMLGRSLAATVWNPAANGISPPAVGDWKVSANWSAGLPSAVGDGKAVFNVNGAAECRVTDTQKTGQFVQGDNGPGGVIRLMSGASVSTSNTVWSAVGYNNPAQLVVEAGGAVTFGQHLWVGFNPGGNGVVDIAGEVAVGGQFGLGWNGGLGTVNVLDGGHLSLTQLHPTNSIRAGSVLDIRGAGYVTLNGNYANEISSYIAMGRITGHGQTGSAHVQLFLAGGITTVTAVPVVPQSSALTLSLRKLGGNTFELTWPRGLGAFAVEISTNDLASPVWSVLKAPVTVAGGRYTQVVSNTTAQALYRLVTAPMDNTTLSNKSMMGYQGWFSAPGDGTLVNDRWHHWGSGYPTISAWKVDFWPDMSEFTAEERFDPGWILNRGGPAQVFSSAHPKTVERHFQWMWDYQIDGVFLQRFISEVQDPRFFHFRNKVTVNVKAGAEKYRRVYAIMYDISGAAESSLLSRITNDWNYLHGTLGVTNSPAYLQHRGKPVVVIWGLGFASREGTPQTATNLINFFKARGMTVMGGVPDSWRTLNGDSKTEPAWADVYRSYDVLSPWTVGRYNSLTGANNWRVNKIVPDLAAATAAGVDYMPVIWPGFSWYNLKGGTSPLNQIPRQGGNFYWRQFYNSQLSGCSMIYTAMFDEVDEGTAMFKMAETTNDLPAGVSMVPLDADGSHLPSDWYLRLAGEATRMLRGEIPLQSAIPIAP